MENQIKCQVDRCVQSRRVSLLLKNNEIDTPISMKIVEKENFDKKMDEREMRCVITLCVIGENIP